MTIQEKFNEYIRKQVGKVRKNPERTRQRIDLARKLRDNYQKLMSLSDTEVRLSNLQSRTILPEIDDPVYQKLKSALFWKGEYETKEQRAYVIDRITELMSQIEKREMKGFVYETLNIKGVASPRDIIQVLQGEHKERKAVNY